MPKKEDYMPYLDRLKEFKEQKDLTNAEIATLSNIPLATITRIFNGATPNPTFETFVGIATALGVSLDEIAGLKSPHEEAVPSRVEMTINSYAELLKEKDDRIRELKEEKKQERKEKARLMLFFAIFTTIVTFILAIDILNGNWGYFRH